MPTPQRPLSRPVHPDTAQHQRKVDAMLRQPWERVVFFSAIVLAIGLAIVALVLTFA